MNKVVKYRGRIKIIDGISAAGLEALEGDYLLGGDEIKHPDAIIVRSSKISVEDYPGVKIITRAGAGYDNIDTARAAHLGIVVSTTPKGNANAVCELIYTMIGMQLRHVAEATEFVKTVHALDESVLQSAIKKRRGDFAGSELRGKTLGVIGLGQIGVLVANTGIERGMRVIGYDPYATLTNMHQLDHRVRMIRQRDQIGHVLENADIITVHVPLNQRTRGLIGAPEIAHMKQGGILLNYARGEVVDIASVLAALDAGSLQAYITDFATQELRAHPKVTCTPHLGASTEEAGEGCAAMAAMQIKEYLEYGNVINAVNIPNVEMPCRPSTAVRLAVINRDVPDMIGKITHLVGEYGHNIQGMTNSSNGSFGYNIIDFDADVPSTITGQIEKMPGVVRVRAIRFPK